MDNEIMTVGSLFSGIGGIEKGLEDTGHFKTIWQVELDGYATKVLEKHWPNVKRYGDIRTVRGSHVSDSDSGGHLHGQTEIKPAERGKPSLGESQPSGSHENVLEYVDLICGGFPCQDISNANPKGKGLEGTRSGLWFEFARIIGEVRPRYVLVENVPALTRKGFDKVLGLLAEIGYDAEWDCIRASDFGYPHRRERIFIVAYAKEWRGHIQDSNTKGNADDERRVEKVGQSAMENSELNRWRGWDNGDARRRERPLQIAGPSTADKSGFPAERRIFQPFRPKDWVVEPRLGRVADGISNRVDRLKCIGNAVVPACAEHIGNLIWEHHNRMAIENEN